MTPSLQAAQLVAEFEGFNSESYQDMGGVWTIGFGTTRIGGVPVGLGMHCTLEQGHAYMLEEFTSTAKELSHHLFTLGSLPPLPQYQFDALISFAYNVGVGGFRRSTITRKLITRQPETITESNFTAWNKVRIHAVLTPVAGLTRRRKSEYHLFRTGTLKFQF